MLDVRSGKSLSFLSILDSKSNPTSSPWVSSVNTDATDSWLVAGGGGQKQALGNPQANFGHISIWHIPSRTKTVVEKTEMDIHQARFFGENDDILSVGNQSCAELRQSSSGALLSQMKSSSIPSHFFTAVQDKTDVVATGGCSSSIDIFTTVGYRSFSLQF